MKNLYKLFLRELLLLLATLTVWLLIPFLQGALRPLSLLQGRSLYTCILLNATTKVLYGAFGIFPGFVILTVVMAIFQSSPILVLDLGVLISRRMRKLGNMASPFPMFDWTWLIWLICFLASMLPFFRGTC
jgi:hypothetical protein